MTFGWIETRLKASEDAIEYLRRLLQDLIPQIRAANQAARNAGGFGDGGGGGQVYLCMAPASGSWAATGTWPALTPGSFTADVYIASGASLTLTSAGATIRNWYPASPAVSKVLEVASDGTGGFVTVAQSCA